MGKGIASHDGLVRLHRHTHEGRYGMGHLMEMSGLDVRIYRNILAASDCHHHLFHCCISCPLAHSVHGHFDLARSVHNAGDGVGRCHSEVVVAMGRDDGLVYVRNIIHEVFYLSSILRRKAVACGVGDINHCGTGLDDRLDDSCKIFIVSAACILCIELHIVNEPAGIFHCRYGTLKDFLLIGIELIFNMIVRGAYSRMDSLEAGKMKGISRYINIFFDGAGQGAQSRFGHNLGDFHDGLEVTGAGDGESALDDVHLHIFKLLCELDLLNGVQLTSGNLFSVPESRVKNVKFLVHIVRCYILFKNKSPRLTPEAQLYHTRYHKAQSRRSQTLCRFHSRRDSSEREYLITFQFRLTATNLSNGF